MIFYVGLADYFVEISSNVNSLFETFQMFLGNYYDICAINDGKVIATVNYISDNLLHDAKKTFYASRCTKDIVLRNGRYIDNQVFGKVAHIQHGIRAILNLTSESIYEINDTEHTVNIYAKEQGHASKQKEIVLFIRNQILQEYLESKGGISVHAASFSKKSVGHLALGHSGSGKTTFLLSALSSGEYALHSSDSVIMFPYNDAIYLYAIPNQIRILPGTLRAFPQTKYIVSNVSESDDVKQQSKITMQWREIADIFECESSPSAIVLKHIYLLDYCGGHADRDYATTKEINMSQRSFEPFILTSKDLQERPRWLGWFQPDCANSLMDMITNVRTKQVEWSKISQLQLLWADVSFPPSK